MTSVGDVLAIIDATIKVVDATRTIYNANKEKEELRKWIQTLADTLRGFIDVSTSLTGQNRIVFDSINAQIEDRMASVQKRLVEEKGGFKRRLNRLLWPARRNKAREDIEAIEKLDEQVRKVFQTQDTEDGKLRRLVSFLTPDIHASLLKTPARVQNLTKGTIEWIWKNEQYLDWGESESGILWVFGIQGAGKTGMAEYISTTLREEAGSPPSYHVARVFCDHQTLPGLNDHLDIVMSLWCQLEHSIGGLTVEAETLRKWIRKMEAGPFLSEKDHKALKMEVLSYTISKAGKTLLILDGLDEVPSDYQRDVVDMLRDVLKRNNQCRLMVTSRPYANITALAVEEPKLVLRATSHDIELYIHDRISRSRNHLFLHHQTTKHVITELKCKCDGTFLMAKLHMDEVLKAESEAECWDIIQNLPAEASQAYEKGLQRLAEAYRKPEGNMPCSAIQALFWVVFAKAPMTSRQLQQALAIRATDSKYNSQNEIIQGIDTLCGELLIVEPETQEVRVAHKTITDYLMKPETQRAWFPHIRKHMSLTLIRYLSLDDLNEPLYGHESTKQFQNRHPLLTYALMYWGTDISRAVDDVGSDAEIRLAVDRFLKSQHNDWNSHVLQQVAQMIKIKSNRRLAKSVAENAGLDAYAEGRLNLQLTTSLVYEDAAVAPGRIGGLHWAVIFSLKSSIKLLYRHERQYSIKGGLSLTPLGLAAAHDRTAMAMELLHVGACPDGKDYNCNSHRPPLCDALLFGRKDIVSLLLEHDASLTLRRHDNDRSALDLLYTPKLEPLAPLVAESISQKRFINYQEYLLLVKGGFVRELKVAIQNGLDVNQACGNGKNALDYALELENEKIISILEEHGAYSRLLWDDQCSMAAGYPRYAPEPYSPGGNLSFKQKVWVEDLPFKTVRPTFRGNSEDHLVMQVSVDERIKLPVRAVVFETMSAHFGTSWGETSECNYTYLGSSTTGLAVRVVHGIKRSKTLTIQHNIRKAYEWRMHTNIWDVEDSETLSPLRTKLIKSLKHGSQLQILTQGSSLVHKLRVTVYGQI